jgi:copper resistance protein C
VRRALRAGVLALVCGFALLLTVGTASAHSRLESSDPPDGTSLATSPKTVSLTFNEQMQQGFATLTVIGPGSTAWQNGDTQVSGDTISVAVDPLGPAGVYTIGYRVVSADGHPVSGKVSFTLTQAGPGDPAKQPVVGADPTAIATVPTAGSDDGGSAPVWPWVVGAVIAVGAGVVVALRLGRS